jgi:hypothetical protein
MRERRSFVRRCVCVRRSQRGRGAAASGRAWRASSGTVTPHASTSRPPGGARGASCCCCAVAAGAVAAPCALTLPPGAGATAALLAPRGGIALRACARAAQAAPPLSARRAA